MAFCLSADSVEVGDGLALALAEDVPEAVGVGLATGSGSLEQPANSKPTAIAAARGARGVMGVLLSGGAFDGAGGLLADR